jgi:hypothetical protein
VNSLLKEQDGRQPAYGANPKFQAARMPITRISSKRGPLMRLPIDS